MPQKVKHSLMKKVHYEQLLCTVSALEWILPSHAAAVICTDSQSLLKAIQSGSTATADLRRIIKKRAKKTTLLRIPGHNEIAGNKETDACAKQATAITDGSPRPVSFDADSAPIRWTLNNPPPCHCRIKELYTKTFSWPSDSRAVSRQRDAVLLARRRVGHPPPLFKANPNQLVLSVDPKCHRCG